MTDRLTLCRTLGDPTRHSIYEELCRADGPRSTAEIAATLGLHPNTVRPHLERMREVGLLELEVESRGSVGRPQHRYSVAPEAPAFGAETPALRALSRMLADVAAFMAPDPEDVAAMAWDQGGAAAERRRGAATACEVALADALGELGFDPATVADGDSTTIRFTQCPYRELAEAYPDLICNLHRGLVEGFVARMDGTRVTEFATLADRDPCRVVVQSR